MSNSPIRATAGLAQVQGKASGSRVPLRLPSTQTSPAHVPWAWKPHREPGVPLGLLTLSANGGNNMSWEIT